jgi:acetylglutamate kinase
METLKVIKIGGQIIDDDIALQSFLKDFSEIPGPKILIHGGGLEASRLSKKMGIKVNKIEGRRVTDAETLDVIVMTYAGLINKRIVALLQNLNCNAIGFTGADGNTVISKKRSTTPVDFGFVGDIIQLNTSVLESLLKQNIQPVFCAITHDKNGQLLNTNADTLASELAIAFSKIINTELYICFEKNGVLTDVNDDNSVVKILNKTNYQELLKEGKIADGMLPKLENCFRALNHGVSLVCVGKPEMIGQNSSVYTKIQE